MNLLASVFMSFVFGQLHLAEQRKGRWLPHPIVLAVSRNLSDWIVEPVPALSGGSRSSLARSLASAAVLLLDPTTRRAIASCCTAMESTRPKTRPAIPTGWNVSNVFVAEHHRDGAQALRDAILRDVEAFRGGAVQDDDVTVVVVKVV